MEDSDDDSQSLSRSWIYERISHRKDGNSKDEVVKTSLHLDHLPEDKVRSLMNFIIEINPDMDEVVQAFLEVCDLPEMEAKLIQLKEKAIMHIHDSHVSPSELQHGPWNCFDVPNPLAHFMRVCVIQGKRLLKEEQWEETVNYVLMSWRHVNSIPDLDNLINWAKQNCFKFLAKQCKKALEMMQNSLSKDKCEVFLERMNVAYLQNAAIQPCVDIVGQFLSQLQHSPGEGHSVCSQPITIE